MKGSVMDKLDPELKTYYLQVKDEVKKEHTTYINKHPEIRQLLNDFLSTVLLEKPDDVYAYAQEYFSYFNTEKEPEQYKPLVLSGPPGVGKETLIQMLLKHFPDKFEVSISHTSRKPRPDEQEGERYFFISPEEFTSEITRYSFIEYSQVDGDYYGTHKQYLKAAMERSKVCIIKVDFKGAQSVSKSGADCNYVWIDPPSVAELKERLIRRGEDQETVEGVVKDAENEMKQAKSSNLYNKFILNNDTEATFNRLVETLNEMYPDLGLKL